MNAPFEVGCSDDQSYIYVRVLSPVTLELALSFTDDFTRLGTELNIYCCLIDIRGTRSRSGTLGKYQYAYKEAKAHGLTKRWKMALLKDGEDRTPNFLAVVMQNAGYTFQIFSREDAAVDWLNRGPTSVNGNGLH